MNLDRVTFGPFRGYQSSVEAVNAPPEFIVGSTDGLSGSRDVTLDPSSGLWSRRKGCAIRGDTVTNGLENTGLLESGMKFSAIPLRLFAMFSPSSLSKRPTYAVLFGKDGNSDSFPTVDTGWFGTLYLRSSATATDPQTPSGNNYNLLSEFGSSHYPTNTGSFTPSSAGLIVCPPMWYESGDGGYTRGAFRFARQMLTAGSRDAVVAGRRMFFPSLRATPFNWDQTHNTSTGTGNANTVRYFPTGPFPPLPSFTIASETAATGNDAAWADGDTFYYSVVFKFEDGSYSAPMLPRATNAILTSGLGLRVVGTIGNTAKYRSVTWSNIPVGPDGTIARILLRTPKQSRTAATDTITIEPLDLRPCGILTNNTQTTFIDTAGSDVGLLENDNVVRFDLLCPRRGRYLWTGDQRVLTGWTLPSPHAIMLAPTGASAAGDLSDEADDSANLQGTTGYVYRITSTQLELYQYTGSTTLGAAFAIDWATYPTIQDVVDKINTTAVGSSCKQWRAQIAPGCDPSAASSGLCPSTRQVLNCSTGGVASSTLTTTASFVDIPIGTYITGTGVTTGTYVVSKQTATSLTLSQNATVTAGTTLDFSSYTGDGTGAANYWSGNVVGLMRAFGGAYPGFVYLKRSAQQGYDRPDKHKVFFTAGSPGAASAGSSLAGNAWAADNVRLPSIPNPGQLLGGGDIEGAAVVAYTNGLALFQNRRGANTGEDFDYKLFTLNGKRGPVSWGGIAYGNGWCSYVTREGVFCADKNLREFSLGGAIFNPSRKIGDLAYQIKLCAAATESEDTDGQGLRMSALNSRLAISYINSAGTTGILHYDFSPGIEASGVEELVDPNTRSPYGWYAPHVYNVANSINLGVIGAVPSSVGVSLYACHSGNNSATADGRVDEIETGNSDNGEAQFSGYAYMPQFSGASFSRMSLQRVQLKHRRPNGTALTFLKVSRDQTFAASNSYNLSNTGSDQFVEQLIQMKSNPDRSPCTVVWLLWQDNEATQGNGFWALDLEYQSLPQ